ncbi:MAG TPA: isoprenylcysteine carboxylmethyltransferase family protein [Terriglobales bacterium]|nr:isoprenylcysteine carboxylmethyltransferase family protein [Terriglobales bacterium]
MKPLIYSSPYAWIFWIVFTLVYLPEFGLVTHSRPQKGESTDRGSLLVIMISGWIGYPIAFSLAGSKHFHLSHERFWFFLGLGLLVSGSLLRRYCWRVLGQFFTGNVRIHEGQSVIQQGPYRLVRHPSYTGGMLMHTGCGLALANWMGALVLLVTAGLGYLYRVNVEEKALVNGLGEEYREYMQRTKRFVPYVV